MNVFHDRRHRKYFNWQFFANAIDNILKWILSDEIFRQCFASIKSRKMFSQQLNFWWYNLFYRVYNEQGLLCYKRKWYSFSLLLLFIWKTWFHRVWWNGGLCEKLVKSELTPKGNLCKSCIGTCTFFLYWL